jgi:DNA-binding MarR family transcriptional regulator
MADQDRRRPEQVLSDAGNETTGFKFMQSSSGNDHHLWRFVTNHAHVLACIAADPTARLRDIAATVGITERTAGQIVSELEQAGYLTKTRVGRRNNYEVHGELPLRHPQHRHHTVGELIRFLQAPGETGLSRARTDRGLRSA